MGKLSLVSAIALVVSIAASGVSCTTEEGSTPTCTEDLSKGYPDRSVATGCNRFAGCFDANGNAQPVENCCLDPMGMPLAGPDLQLCLYGYGAADPALLTGATSGGGGGAGGGTTTTTTTTGGGGNGGAGGASGGGGTGG